MAVMIMDPMNQEQPETKTDCFYPRDRPLGNEHQWLNQQETLDEIFIHGR